MLILTFIYRNESSGQKTLNFKNSECFVKENFHLSRERVTVFTQISSEENDGLPTEFVWKGKENSKRIKVNPPPGTFCQFAEKGSYRLSQMLKTIRRLPNRSNMFTNPKPFGIYVLDDYAVHLMKEVREELLKRGWILVVIGGGVTGDVQVSMPSVEVIPNTPYLFHLL